jgi:hypothetical protein
MITHDEFLELAAAAIDFELSPAERIALDAHLAECVPCRRRVLGLDADQRAIRHLPVLELAPATVAGIRGRVLWRQRSDRSPLRMVAIAAVVAILALAAIAVGSELLRRDRDRDLTNVPPSLTPLELPEEEPAALQTGSMADVIVTDLRVRTAPTVDDTKSAKLEPVLGRGTQLRILEGPVTADDYDWYRIEAIGWPHRGWVAAADHDGAPWIRSETAVESAKPTLAPAEAALMVGLRPDAAIECTPRRTRLPARAIAAVECRINAAVVRRVGLYGFRDARDAALTYLERLATYDVAPASGDCAGGTTGDRAWQTGDREPGPARDRVSIGDTGPWVLGRIGCFLDEEGHANVRVTCGSTYVGILGRDDDLADVDRWAWSSPGGPVDAGEPPGICPHGA